ncbi:uncharacterized protein [Amphiura filiformis]|uniref:uncharacterized protein isoform X2 n=1 Tax=Amphiura filiformis TaxID=82378 RepID=UPI003B21D1FA
MEPVAFIIFIVLWSFAAFPDFVGGTKCLEGNGPDHSICPRGEYCSYSTQDCEVCQPCGHVDLQDNPNGLPDGWIQKCRDDYKNDGVGECFKNCQSSYYPVTDIDFSSWCERKLVCESFETVTDRNSPTARVGWSEPKYEPQADSAGKTIRQQGSNYTYGDAFPIGTTQIHYGVIEDNMAQCTVNITVHDDQPPLMNCPADITVYTTESNPRNITWSDPEVTDNSGNWTLHLLHPSDSGLLPPGITSVVYEAADPSGNSRNCSFNIYLKVVSLECLQNQTKPVVTGRDENVYYECNHPPDYDLTYGEMSLECSLYGKDDELITSCSSLISIVKPDTSTPLPLQRATTYLTTKMSPPENQMGLQIGVPLGIIIVIALLALIVFITCIIYRRNQQTHRVSLQHKPPGGLAINGIHPEMRGLENTVYEEENEMSPTQVGGNNKTDSIRNQPDGSIHGPNISNHSTPNGDVTAGYSPLQNSEDDFDQGIDEVFGNTNETGAKCNQTVSELLEHPSTVQWLCMHLDPYEQLLKCVSAAYGLGHAKHKHIVYYKDPVKYPVLAQILEHIKDTDKYEGEDRQNIFRLLQELYSHRGDYPDAPIVKSIKTVLNDVHKNCLVCNKATE